MASELRSIVSPGLLSSVIVTALPVRFLLMPKSPNSSSACAREPSSSCCFSLARFSASVSSSSDDMSSSICRRRRAACLCSSTRCAFDLWFFFASASALALASAAFLAFSRSTSESSAADHDSRTYTGINKGTLVGCRSKFIQARGMVGWWADAHHYRLLRRQISFGGRQEARPVRKASSFPLLRHLFPPLSVFVLPPSTVLDIPHLPFAMITDGKV